MLALVFNYLPHLLSKDWTSSGCNFLTFEHLLPFFAILHGFKLNIFGFQNIWRRTNIWRQLELWESKIGIFLHWYIIRGIVSGGPDSVHWDWVCFHKDASMLPGCKNQKRQQYFTLLSISTLSTYNIYTLVKKIWSTQNYNYNNRKLFKKKTQTLKL